MRRVARPEGEQSRAIYIGLGVGVVLLGFVFCAACAGINRPTGTNPTVDASTDAAASTEVAAGTHRRLPHKA